MKPLAVIKAFYFDGKATVDEMKTAIAGFSRPLNDDPDYRYIVEGAAKELKEEVEW